jgi:hypothetical protein
MKQAVNKYAQLLILLLIAAGAWMRATAYGSLYLSMGMLDTDSYVAASASANSPGTFFMGRRLPSMNLFYKFVEGGMACQLTSSSRPDEGVEGVRTIQPCFNTIVLMQNILSIFGWCLFAWAVSRRLRSLPAKMLAVFLILLFGFTPQIAEWDSILSSESPSGALFPIMLTLLMEVVFRISEKGENQSDKKINILIAGWMLVFVIWLFIRDVHVYAVPVTLILTAPLLLVKDVRKLKGIAVVLVVLVILFVAANYASKSSPRWQSSLEHVLDYYIFPYPARVEFFAQHGMPKDRESAEYKTWFNDQGVKTYGLFLISHSGFVVTSMLDTSSYFKSDFIQPHFKSPEIPYRGTLLTIGEIFHPETNAVYVIDLILLFSLCAAAFKRRDKESIAWAWIASWILLYSAISLFISFFGDIDGTRRHIYPSVEQFRLFLWIFLTLQFDRALTEERTISVFG